ncbi:dCTP deaminase [Halomicroarcula sp. S1AR25-4]|uniref:dCTP deaminase n=1 Tax=Haloarcula sp. S1AR25-4 TaxID=2950538 RepID=UPI002875996A|nr:dCTP deaminase [Halomicroarcula sp. S1AR25-4]MDS0279256.1 dCTP deaminase [Halomicroarcula sp. S1AR25-4]
MADLSEYVTDAVHEQTQTDSPGFDLTVAEVYEVVDPGRIDFGGGELEPAGTAPHASAKRDPEDDYDWWTLRAGQYLVEFNESLTGETTVTVQPRTELLERGATHPTLHVDELPRIPLSVGGAGLRLKANARVSTIVDAEKR